MKTIININSIGRVVEFEIASENNSPLGCQGHILATAVEVASCPTHQGFSARWADNNEKTSARISAAKEMVGKTIFLDAVIAADGKNGMANARLATYKIELLKFLGSSDPETDDTYLVAL